MTNLVGSRKSHCRRIKFIGNDNLSPLRVDEPGRSCSPTRWPIRDWLFNVIVTQQTSRALRLQEIERVTSELSYLVSSAPQLAVQLMNLLSNLLSHETQYVRLPLTRQHNILCIPGRFPVASPLSNAVAPGSLNPHWALEASFSTYLTSNGMWRPLDRAGRLFEIPLQLRRRTSTPVPPEAGLFLAT